MRILLILVVMVFVTTLKAQMPFSGSFQNNRYGTALAHNNTVYDSNTQKKWFITRSAGITSGYSFFNHGSARFLAGPVSLQLNRSLNNNLYAFAGVTIAPSYINFNRTFLNTDLNKVKPARGFYQPGNFSMCSAATMGLMYINNERTFSVSGSISIERNSYPLFYNNQLNTVKPNNTIPPSR